MEDRIGLERLRTDDWEEAFSDITEFRREDVERIVAIHELRVPDHGAEGVAMFCLKNGRYASLRWETTGSGWGQFTGSAHAYVGATKDEVIRLGLTDDDRENLKLPLCQ